jgi:hypothetical protein
MDLARSLRGWIFRAVLPAAAFGCAPGVSSSGDDDPDDSGSMTTMPGDDSDTDSDTLETSDTDPPEAGWFQVGWGIDSFAPIENGSEFTIVWGTQGAAMFPMPVRGGDFVLPDDPGDYTDPKAPLMDLELDIEGHNDGFGGHFKRIANYPLVFEVLEDGTYEFLYVAIILPDDKDPLELEGLPAHLHVTLRPYEVAPIEIDLDLVVATEPAPG